MISEYLLVVGMSGAGRSTAAASLEDIGWFVIDNMPPSLIPEVVKIVERRDPGHDRLAFVVGRGGTIYVDELMPALVELRKYGAEIKVLFLDAPDEVLVRRFESTRRRHPVAASDLSSAVAAERSLLASIRESADILIDTGALNPNQLRARIIDLFTRGKPLAGLKSSIVSFGYKYGLPLDVDLVFDCRFLPNPYWEDDLRELTGLDEKVRSYVLSCPETQVFLDKLEDLLLTLLPAYAHEGKSYLSVAMGCTGGEHRSVVLTEELSSRLAARGFEPSVFHRDLNRAKLSQKDRSGELFDSGRQVPTTAPVSLPPKGSAKSSSEPDRELFTGVPAEDEQ
ncbi:MAG: RNase adapter RapZ [Actinobacteria bacterium]|jgi:UPF0042 nucleotide-binding protein|nr:RNase adapter RapZ [Actinomycetota bacterium]MCL6094538.1 RNase adapter RapZ [Actinomycetota bacterium]